MRKLGICLLAVCILSSCDLTEKTVSVDKTTKNINITPNKMRNCHPLGIEETQISNDGQEIVKFKVAGIYNATNIVNNYDKYYGNKKYIENSLISKFFEFTDHGFLLKIEKAEDGNYSNLILVDIPFIKTSNVDENGKDTYIAYYKNNKLILTDVTDRGVSKYNWKLYRIYNDTLLKTKHLKKVIILDCGYEFDIGEAQPNNPVLEEFLTK